MSETPDDPARSPDHPVRSPEDAADAAYTPIAEDAMPEPRVEGDDDVIFQPGAEAFASPGEPSVYGDEDPTSDVADPIPEE